MKDENRREAASWHKRLLTMNLILPVLEIAVIGEALRLAGLLAAHYLDRSQRLRNRS